jgi:peroxiredoxin
MSPQFVSVLFASVWLAQAPASDAHVAASLAKLDARLSASVPATSLVGDPRFTLWDFARSLQNARLSAAQTDIVSRRLDEIGRTRPESSEYAKNAVRMVEELAVGKMAPEIRAKDLDGVEFKLSDYRGKVVVLMFTGDWCGICRAQYPYERELLERYKDAPFALVAVDSSASAAAAKDALARENLAYRAWWDGGGARHTEGPIATEWNVIGWPTVYVLDGDGRIRFVDVRKNTLLTAVHALMNEPVSALKR